MIKKIVCFSLLVFFIASSCSTTKKVASIPAGIEFVEVKNYKDFAVINLPVSGNGFTKMMNVTKRNDANEVVPSVYYEHAPLSVWSSFYDTEGSLDIQFEKIKEKLLKWEIKENSTVVLKRKTINKKKVALIEITTPKKGGVVGLVYGYLVAHNNKASLFLQMNVIVSPSNMTKYKNTLDETLQYIVKTVEFR
jgi:hypothetical protein